MIFIISGIVHVIADFSVGVPLFETGSLQFFCTQALGVMIEDGAQALYRTFLRLNKRDGDPPLWSRVVGYMWVAAFVLVWTTPSWFYPTAALNKGGPENGMLPFSVVRSFTKP